MGFESIPRPKAETSEENTEQATNVAKKWIETVDKNGKKVEIGVFDDESDEDAIARAKAIDERLDREGASESSLS